jgi:hypothetical protein
MTDRSYKYTCKDYRAEMTLVGLKRRLEQDNLTEKEKKDILAEVRKLEIEIGID